jgi:maleate isomerase
MIIKPNYIQPKFKKKTNPKIGLLALSTDLTIESDFQSIFKKLPLDLFVNRIHNENPLTKENLLKMYDQIEPITEKILPGQKINTVAYACTSGTIAIGEDKVKEKVQLAKPGCYVTTPITSAIKAFTAMNAKKIAIFTPYPESVNKTIIEYFNKKNINIISFSTFNIDLDEDIASVDIKYLLDTLIKLNLSDADALFVSCTALPVLEILEEVEIKLKKLVLSSNQTLIWDTIRSVGYKSPVEGFGKLLRK